MLTSIGVFADKAAQDDLQLEQLLHSRYNHSHLGHKSCERTVIDYSCGCKKETVKCCCIYHDYANPNHHEHPITDKR